jgi:hypothetical protein
MPSKEVSTRPSKEVSARPSKEVSTRPSPTQSATLYTIGTKKTGNDGNTWIITQNVNGTKRWKLYKKVSKKISKKISKKKIKSLNNFGFTPVYEKNLDKIMETHNKVIYDKIKKNIIPELNKLGIETYIVPLPLSKNGHYFTDYASEYIKEVYNKDMIERLNIKDIYFVFYLTNDGKKLNKDKIVANYTPFGNKKKNVIEIFKKYLGNKFDWDGSNTKVIIIKL